MESDSSRVPAITRAAWILEILAAERAPLRLAELARRTGIAKSSVLNLCASLVEERLVLRGEDGSYRLGPYVLELAAPMQAHPQPTTSIGMTVQTDANPFFAAEIQSAYDEAARNGASIESVHANGDPLLQEAQIHDFVEAGAVLVIVDPVDSSALADVAEYARESGTTIVAINGSAINVDGAVTTDNAQAGFLAGQHLTRVLPVGAEVAIIDGAPITAIADRVDGFRRAVAEAQHVSIVAHLVGDNSAETGEALAKRLLREHRELAGILAINDPTAIGASHAYTAAEQPITIVGVDGSRAAVAEIARAHNIHATAVQDPYLMARAGVRLGLQLVSGSRPLNRTVLLRTKLISSINVEGYTPW